MAKQSLSLKKIVTAKKRERMVTKVLYISEKTADLLSLIGGDNFAKGARIVFETFKDEINSAAQQQTKKAS